MAEITYVSMFSGVGGLDLGLRCAVPDARCIGYVERDIHAAEVLACRIDEGSLDDAPIWSDVRTFPSDLYRGRVAGIVAGFPCPDYSVAGSRAGIVGKHGQLWDYLRIAVRDIQPDWVFLENVAGILVGHSGGGSKHGNQEAFLPAGLWFVLGDLAELGFDAEWTCLRASEVGASHGRNRWFCLAYRPSARRQELPLKIDVQRGLETGIGKLGDPDRASGEAFDDIARRGIDERNPDASGFLGYADEPRLEGRGGTGRDGNQRAAGASGGPDLADAASRERCGGQEYGERRTGPTGGEVQGIFAPGPSWDGWPDLLVRHPELRPAISPAEAEQLVCGVADGVAETLAGSRTDQLRATGNGVVPLHAAAAFVELARRAGLSL